MNENNEKANGIVVDGRASITVRRVISVDSFDEERISATLEGGDVIVVDGNALVINDVNLDNNTLSATGVVCGINYFEKSTSAPTSALKRLFGIK